MEDIIKLMWPNHYLPILQMKMISNETRPKNIKSGIWWPLTEEDFKIFRVDYLSNHWSDLTQILNLSLGDQTKL